MKWIFLITFLNATVNFAFTQPIHELKIGDSMPEIMLTKLGRDTTTEISLRSLYKDKNVILDFWATWCVACLKNMPKCDSINKEFINKVIILPVTYEAPRLVKHYISKSKVLANLNLEFIVNDSILMGGYFKFLSIPHLVWIDKKGIVKAITYAEDLTRVNVSQFVNGEELTMREKKENATFNVFEQNLPVADNSFLYRSVVTEYKPEFNHMIGSLSPTYGKDLKMKRFFGINQSIFSLFYATFTKSTTVRIYFNRIELHVNDTLALFPSYKGEEMSFQSKMNHIFCYELELPGEVPNETFYSYALADLNRLFPYSASIEKKM